MRRPAGEPATIAAGSRGLGAAAGALREVRGRLAGATSFTVTAGAWRGPASQAFLVDGARSQAALDRAAQALDRAAGALSELAARLEHAQATWDRAQRLAATVGVDLDRLGDDPSPPLRSRWNPNGGVRSPADAVDPAAALVAGRPWPWRPRPGRRRRPPAGPPPPTSTRRPHRSRRRVPAAGSRCRPTGAGTRSRRGRRRGTATTTRVGSTTAGRCGRS
jgi:hypothetical protein